jgi:spore photoproduct lyase
VFPDKIYYEKSALTYDLGIMLKEKFKDSIWIEIDSHNNIEELRTNSNKQFPKMKQHLIIGTRKTHKYAPNHKVSDFLVPYTSSGCSAMCLYCYLVCNYNKCSYLRLFVNREQMLDKIIKTSKQSYNELTFEIGSNSDLVLENTITKNLEWTIEKFGKNNRGFITLPTKFNMVETLLPLEHKGRTIFRMSVNPVEIIEKIEYGTSSLDSRITALNQMCEADYKVGILIAPVILIDNWMNLYSELFEELSQKLSKKAKKNLFIEVIFMTYSFVQRAINNEAFPNAVELYDKALMTGRGRGKYCYRDEFRVQAEQFLKAQVSNKLGNIPIIYIV